MSIHIVRLGSPRAAGEGLRIGTVRRPPRGVPKAAFASGNWYDVWYPNLAPSVETMKLGQAAQDAEAREGPAAGASAWAAFAKAYRAEMAAAEPSRSLDLLAALSHQTHFALGCYCAHEARCHRSLLRELLQARGAELQPAE